MLGKSGHQAKQFGWIHEIACPSENEIYVAELLNWRVQKLLLQARRREEVDRRSVAWSGSWLRARHIAGAIDCVA